MKTITALMILLSALPTAADEIETLIAPMVEPLQTGQKTTIGIYIHNTGKENVVVDLPDRLTCLVKSETKTAEVAAYPEVSPAESSATIAPMGFLKVRYVFLVPDGFDGPVRLEIPAFEGASLLVALSKAHRHRRQRKLPRPLKTNRKHCPPRKICRCSTSRTSLI